MAKKTASARKKTRAKRTAKSGVKGRSKSARRPKATQRPSTAQRKGPKAPAPVLIPVGLLTTSFRLPPDLLGKLRLAATQRRNRLDKPYSQSSIVEQAIGEWLERNGER